MTLKDVPRCNWPSFLEGFSRRHRAWRGTFHGLIGGEPVTRIPSAALKSVTLERDGTGPVLRITFLNGVSLCAARPCIVRVETDNGAERALEAETCNGGFIRLAFRAAAEPEELDGVAPSELIA